MPQARSHQPAYPPPSAFTAPNSVKIGRQYMRRQADSTSLHLEARPVQQEKYQVRMSPGRAPQLSTSYSQRPTSRLTILATSTQTSLLHQRTGPITGQQDPSSAFISSLMHSGPTRSTVSPPGHTLKPTSVKCTIGPSRTSTRKKHVTVDFLWSVPPFR